MRIVVVRTPVVAQRVWPMPIVPAGSASDRARRIEVGLRLGDLEFAIRRSTAMPAES